MEEVLHLKGGSALLKTVKVKGGYAGTWECFCEGCKIIGESGGTFLTEAEAIHFAKNNISGHMEIAHPLARDLGEK